MNKLSGLNWAGGGGGDGGGGGWAALFANMFS